MPKVGISLRQKSQILLNYNFQMLFASLLGVKLYTVRTFKRKPVYTETFLWRTENNTVRIYLLRQKPIWSIEFSQTLVLLFRRVLLYFVQYYKGGSKRTYETERVYSLLNVKSHATNKQNTKQLYLLNRKPVQNVILLRSLVVPLSQVLLYKIFLGN